MKQTDMVLKLSDIFGEPNPVGTIRRLNIKAGYGKKITFAQRQERNRRSKQGRQARCKS